MKKIKVEMKNHETGEDEPKALNVGLNVVDQQEEELFRGGNEDEPDDEEEEEDVASENVVEDNKLDDSKLVEEIVAGKIERDRSDSFDTNSAGSDQQLSAGAVRLSSPQQTPANKQQQQQQQQPLQQLPNLQRALPPGAPANYCNICNKELCNKYFMKTHMQKMHGINLDDYPREAANSGGVVCDVCQKELCSKYFLKVHKTNTHGITDFSGGSASSQAANAATAVAAIALTNYSLTAQKQAALNLVLNQHQSRQAAALMNVAAASAAFNPLHMAQAAKAAALHQRDQLNASSLIGHLQQQQQQQPQAQSATQRPVTSPQHRQQQRQQQLHSPPNNLSVNNPLNAAFPAALLANNATNPLLAAQLAQQQQQQQQQQYAPFNSNQAGQQHQTPSHMFFQTMANESAMDAGLDTEDDTSDRDSLGEQTNEHKNRLALSSFHQQLQNQQAFLNAAVFNPAAAAAVMAMQQQQQQQQQQDHQLFDGGRQQAAMDLRSQSISQLFARQMMNANQPQQQPLQQHQQQRHQIVSINGNAQCQPAPVRLYNHTDDIHRQRLEVEDEEDEDEFDSDRDSLVDDANCATRQGAALQPPTDRNNNSSANNNNNGSLLGSSTNINYENDNGRLINCANDFKRGLLASGAPTTTQSQTTATAGAARANQFAFNRSIGSKNMINRAPINNTSSPTATCLSSSQPVSGSGNPSLRPVTATTPTTSAAAATTTNRSSANSSPQANANIAVNQQQQQISNRTGNNNNSSQNNSGNTNSRYLRHYTEACPICDRRFKSIKWLQSHVMNDHKNEIGNLFNLLVQVLLYSNNNNNNSGNNNNNNSSSNNNSDNGNNNQAAQSGQFDNGASSMAAAFAAAGRSDLVGLDLHQATGAHQRSQQLSQQQQQHQPQTTNQTTTATGRGDV